MGWFGGIVTFILIWWLVLFMVIPFGVRTIGQEDIAKGHDAGAPQESRIGRKLAVTTLVTAILWSAVYFIVDSGVISLRP